MATQMWIFGPGSKEPNKYPPENGYSVDNLEKWVRKGAAEFGIKLTKKPKVPHRKREACCLTSVCTCLERPRDVSNYSVDASCALTKCRSNILSSTGS